MDRRSFLKTLSLSPFISPLLSLANQSKEDFELHLIGSSPHNYILPILEEIQEGRFFWGKCFTTLNHHPQKEVLIKRLINNHWKYSRSRSQSDLTVAFGRLINPAPPSFTLIRDDKIWDIRSKNLLVLWKHINRSYQPSPWITIVSSNSTRLKLYRGNKVSVFTDGKKAESLSLNKPSSWVFTTSRGKIEISIEMGEVRVINSSCRNKICLYSAPVSLEGERIICAPNHFLLEIESQNHVDTAIG
ncbi:MAG: NusG domain II-containing protein [Candidatus Aminicenantaceae bacterium]